VRQKTVGQKTVRQAGVSHLGPVLTHCLTDLLTYRQLRVRQWSE